jgi:single-strand DNA-binding protein
MSINKVILVGNLGKDTELRYTPAGTAVCTFSLATSERFKNKQGENQEKTEWHNIVAWNRLAELCGKYLHKGKQIYMEGKLQTTSYEDGNGIRKYRTEIVMDKMQMLGTSSGKDPVRDVISSPSGKSADAGASSLLEDEVAFDDVPF